MLPAPARLRASGDFRQTLRRGVRAARPTLVVHARHTSPPSTVGFIVSKQLGGAVVRNRVKRRLRHLAAARLPQLRHTPAVCVVVRALPPAASEPGRLAADFDAAWTAAVDRLEARPASAEPGRRP